MRRQSDEEDVRVFQTERFFSAGGEWYFSTREKPELGPFGSRQAAEAALGEYLMECAGIIADPWSVPGAQH